MHTPGPWQYRPAEYDDWGWVRGASGALVACARSGDYLTEAMLDEHRRNKTNPYEGNARLIATAPDMLALIKGTRYPGGGWNGMPERLEGLTEVKDCLAAGVCGCDYGAAVKKAEGR